MSNLNLGSLISARICHDLISPIGAIHNGLELIGLSQRDTGGELDLIAQSADNAGARIRFFRLAFGLGGDQALARSEILSVLRQLYQSTRIDIHWTPAEVTARNDVRLAFLALMCCETALPQGGELRVDHAAGKWSVTGTGKRINASDTLWPYLARGIAPDSVIPAHVQFALLPLVAGDCGRQVSVETDAERVRITF